MAKRLPASMRTRQSLSDVIEGRLSSPAGREELVKLATRLIIEETLEAEARDAVGRDYYERGAEPGSGYRNGYRPGRLKTTEERLTMRRPRSPASRSRTTRRSRTRLVPAEIGRIVARPARVLRLNAGGFSGISIVQWRQVSITNMRTRAARKSCRRGWDSRSR
jgi:hypothetical protein